MSLSFSTNGLGDDDVAAMVQNEMLFKANKKSKRISRNGERENKKKNEN